MFKVNKSASGDQHYITNMEASKEWGDLGLVLEILSQLGAKPLIMSRPINGTLFTASGISPQAQQVYYDKLQALVNGYHMSLVDFHQYTNDRYFSIDQGSHTSRKGWVIVDHALDTFYHADIH